MFQNCLQTTKQHYWVKMPKELLFSVTARDCDWEYMRGTGPGGQKRNKTESKVRCTHRESGAMAEDDTTRQQSQNKRNAFIKMVNSDTFKKWHKIETARRMGAKYDVEKKVEAMMRVKNLRIETKKEGRWVTEINDTDTGSI